MGFVLSRALARFRLPQIQFLYVRARLCYALPSDPASRRTPLRFATLHHHQVVLRTFTSLTLNMLVTQEGRDRAAPAI